VLLQDLGEPEIDELDILVKSTAIAYETLSSYSANAWVHHGRSRCLNRYFERSRRKRHGQGT
jgi:hypothetical protein